MKCASCKHITCNKVNDYNELFHQLQLSCQENNCFNAFRCISFDELQELNYLLDRFLVFCENIDLEELDDYESGDDVHKLYKLVDTLFIKDDRLEICEICRQSNN